MSPFWIALLCCWGFLRNDNSATQSTQSDHVSIRFLIFRLRIAQSGKAVLNRLRFNQQIAGWHEDAFMRFSPRNKLTCTNNFKLLLDQRRSKETVDYYQLIEPIDHAGKNVRWIEARLPVHE